MIATEIIRLKPGRYVRLAAGIWLGKWWWVFLLPLLALGVMAMGDIVYLVAIFALICIVYPGIMMLMYFDHALRPEAAFATLPHKIEVSDKGLCITYFPAEEGARCPKPRFIPIEMIDVVEDNGHSWTITLKSSKYDFIEVPKSAIPPDKADAFVRHLPLQRVE